MRFWIEPVLVAVGIFAGLIGVKVVTEVHHDPAPNVVAADPLPIRVPSGPMLPAPSSDVAVKLAGDTLYVIDADVPVRVLSSSTSGGAVSVRKQAGPVSVYAKFVDGTGKPEFRTYSGKFVYFVTAAQTGKVELLVVPTGEAKPDDSDVIRRTLDVDAGEGPRPPPVPPDPPVPVPTPDADPALVKQYAAGLNKDLTAGKGTRTDAANLAQSYLDTADALEKDARGEKVKTIGDLYTLGFTKSEERAVPRLPYLENTRAVTGAVFGSPFGSSPVTDSNRADWVKAFRRCGLALKEAAK